MLRSKRKHPADGNEDMNSASKLAQTQAPKIGSGEASVTNFATRNAKPKVLQSTSMPSLFVDMLSKAGLTLGCNGNINELNVDQTQFQKELLKLFSLHPGYPVVVEEFVESLLTHLESPKMLHQCLLPTPTSKECSSARSENQESFIRILLGIDIVQMPLMCGLLEKLPELAACEQCDIFDRSQIVDNLPTLIISQFRWLDRIVDSKKLCNKTMELLPLVSVETQKEMIGALPDIINDQEHQTAAEKLCELLEDQELSVTILDTLLNLNIHQDTIAEVKQKVMKTLKSVPLDHLPVLVSFILHNTSQQDAIMTVSELRSNLDFEHTLIPMNASTPMKRGKSDGPNKGIDFLVIEVLQSIFRFQKHVGDAWLKAIEMVDSSKEHKPVDLLILLVLDSLELRRKSVESLMRNKIRSERFTEELVQVTFSSNFSVVKHYFSSVLRLADILLKSVELVLSSFGSSIYHKAFAVSEKFCRQEVIGNLITHVGSGSVFEVNAALETLTILVKHYPESVAPFGTYIKNMLEYLDVLQLAQIRKVYEMLTILAFQGGREGSLLQDEVQMLIRKQLTNPNLKYKQMGVVGALMAVKAMSASANTTKESSSITLSGNASLTLLQKQTIKLLELVRHSIIRFPEVLALFFDELSRLLHRSELDSYVEAWINEMMVQSFQDNFVLEVERGVPLPKCELLDLELRFDLDHSDEDAIAINLMPLIIKDDLLKRGKNGAEAGQYIRDLNSISPLTLAPQFRLLRICETSQHSGSLSGIDACLGCPVYLSHSKIDETFDDFTLDQQHVICTGYFYCINWFREVVNAFAAASVNDLDIRLKVVQRLRDIVDLQLKLQTFISDTANYVPPLVNYDFDCLEASKSVQPQATTSGPKGKAGRKPIAKKRKAANSQEDDESHIQPTVIAPTAKDSSNEKNGTEKVAKQPVDMASYRQFVRELDLEVFLILSVQIHQKTDEIVKSDKLTPRELVFLLDDLALKLSHILVSAKRQSYLKVKSNGKTGFSNLNLYSALEVITSMAKMTANFCQLLEDCSGYFQNLIAENDGVVDGPGFDSEYSQSVASCMLYLLRMFHSIFSWNGFVGDSKSLLTDIISTIASRTVGNRLTQAPFSERLRRAFKYIAKFADSLPSLDCAVMLLKILEAMVQKANNDDLKHLVSTTSETFLKRDWSLTVKKEKGTKYNEKIRSLLQVYFEHSEDTLQSLESIATTSFCEMEDVEEKDAVSTSFSTLNKQTFSVYYAVSLHHLVEVVKSTADTMESSLAKWSQAIHIFHALVDLIKVFNSRSNLASCLKYGRQFVDVFLKQCMPLLDKAFRSHREEVQSLLKKLQLSTRFLQHLCSHSKVIQDITLTNHVPFLKKSLEFFVYRVKAMLAVNNCKEAFWIGNLKNRNLKGEEILSQSQQEEEESEEEDEQENSKDEPPAESEEASNEEMDEESGGDESESF